MHEYLDKKFFANYVIREWKLKNTMFVTVVIFYEVRGRYYCLFKQSFGPLCTIMEYDDYDAQGFSCQNPRDRDKLLKDNMTATQAHQQKTITTFFGPITPTNATSRARDTQMGS